jgi:hypothetical protein
MTVLFKFPYLLLVGAQSAHLQIHKSTPPNSRTCWPQHLFAHCLEDCGLQVILSAADVDLQRLKHMFPATPVRSPPEGQCGSSSLNFFRKVPAGGHQTKYLGHLSLLQHLLAHCLNDTALNFPYLGTQWQ